MNKLILFCFFIKLRTYEKKMIFFLKKILVRKSEIILEIIVNGV
jgi:hypothetical protein